MSPVIPKPTYLLLSLLLVLAALSPSFAQSAATAPNNNTEQTTATTTTPAKLDSPRATMFAYLDAMGRASRGEGDPQQAWQAVFRTFDQSKLAGGDDAAKQAARDLLHVIDQLGTVEESDLPKAGALDGISRFTFFPRSTNQQWVWKELEKFNTWPRGEIVLERSGDGQWRFSAATVAGIGELAKSMAPLPPRHIAPQLNDAEPQDEFADLLGPTFTRTELWQWGTLLGCIFIGLLVGKIVQSSLRSTAARLRKHNWHARATIFDDVAGPASLALLAAGVTVGLIFIYMEASVQQFAWNVMAFLYIVAVGWFLYNLVDLIDVGLRHLTDKTESKLDDALVPLIRKTLRVFLIIVFTLVVAQNIFGLNITGWLAGLGIAGLAVSLAAQDSVKNLFGSLTVFFDKPFVVGDFVTFDGATGTIEEIGFRSTRIRLLSGHLVTLPNMKFIDNKVENITARPSIRREMNVTITYDTPPEKIEQAVEILREILNDQQVVEQGRFDMQDNPPRVAFNELNSDSLNIRAYYWYQMAGDPDRGFFTYLDHCQLVNMMLFRRYADAGIEFAFPTQTLYLAGDPQRELAVKLLGDGVDAGK